MPYRVPLKISENGRLVCEGLVQRWAGKFYWNYSAKWFVDQYTPKAVGWLKQHPFWLASYYDNGMKPYWQTWDEIALGQFQHSIYGAQFAKDYTPTMPTGMEDVEPALIQFSSRIKAPGEYYCYDWNFTPKTEAQFREMWLPNTGTIPTPEPPPVIEPPIEPPIVEPPVVEPPIIVPPVVEPPLEQSALDKIMAKLNEILDMLGKLFAKFFEIFK